MQIHRIFDILTNECVCWCWFFIMVGNLFLRTAIVVVIWGGIMILICSEMTHFTEDCTKTNRNEHWTSPPDVAGVCSWNSFSFGEKEQKKSISQVINNDQFIHNDCTYVDKTNDLDCICSVSSETLTKVHLPSGGGETERNFSVTTNRLDANLLQFMRCVFVCVKPKMFSQKSKPIRKTFTEILKYHSDM